MIHEKFEELSKYYELGGAQKSWATTKLLSRSKCENDREMSCRFAHLGSLTVLEEVSKPPEPSGEPPAQGSALRRAREDTRPIPRTARGTAKRNAMHGIDESGDDLKDTGEDSDEGSVWEKEDSSSDSDSGSELEW